MFCSAFEDCAVAVGSVGAGAVELEEDVGGCGVNERGWIDGGSDEPDILKVLAFGWLLPLSKR